MYHLLLPHVPDLPLLWRCSSSFSAQSLAPSALGYFLSYPDEMAGLGDVRHCVHCRHGGHGRRPLCGTIGSSCSSQSVYSFLWIFASSTTYTVAAKLANIQLSTGRLQQARFSAKFLAGRPGERSTVGTFIGRSSPLLQRGRRSGDGVQVERNRRRRDVRSSVLTH